MRLILNRSTERAERSAEKFGSPTRHVVPYLILESCRSQRSIVRGGSLPQFVWRATTFEKKLFPLHVVRAIMWNENGFPPKSHWALRNPAARKRVVFAVTALFRTKTLIGPACERSARVRLP